MQMHGAPTAHWALAQLVTYQMLCQTYFEHILIMLNLESVQEYTQAEAPDLYFY